MGTDESHRGRGLAAIASLYNGENAWRSGTVVRDAETWKGFPRSVGWWTKPAIKVAVEGCEADISYSRNSGFMGRIMRFLPFMQKLAEGLGRESDQPLPDGEVALITDLGACILACKGGRLVPDGDGLPVGAGHACRGRTGGVVIADRFVGRRQQHHSE